MFKKETEYALRALVYIWKQNKQGRRPGIVETAEEIIAPQPFTAKILQRLVKSGIISSQRGKGGGFFFLDGKADISLEEIIIMMEGDKIFRACGFGLHKCSDDDPCPVHDQYVEVRNTLKRIFGSNTIQDLAENE